MFCSIHDKHFVTSKTVSGWHTNTLFNIPLKISQLQSEKMKFFGRFSFNKGYWFHFCQFHSATLNKCLFRQLDLKPWRHRGSLNTSLNAFNEDFFKKKWYSKKAENEPTFSPHTCLAAGRPRLNWSPVSTDTAKWVTFKRDQGHQGLKKVFFFFFPMRRRPWRYRIVAVKEV